MNVIPLVDLKAQYAAIRPEIDAAIQRVLESTRFIMGPEVTAFESEFAHFCRAEHAIGMASGTAALQLALLAVGVRPGDEVITVAHTFFATAEAIVNVGATPIFVDVDPLYYTLDPAKLEAAITPKTRAILPVHLYGQAADMQPICALAEKYGIKIVEDAAQAHGATYAGQPVGAFGACACFSFYPGKNLGAYGDAGAVTTNDAQIAASLRRLRDHGRSEKYTHQIVGFGERLDALQAAVLAIKLEHLADWNARRQRLAQVYTECMSDRPELVLPAVRPGAEHVFHLFVIRTAGREQLAKFLKENGVQTGVHYPIPLHLQPAFQDKGYLAGSLPVSERLAAEVLSLPLYPELTEAEVERIAGLIARFFQR